MVPPEKYSLKSEIRVMLINPPASGGIRMVREGKCMQREGAWTVTWPPLTLALIAAILKREGFRVSLHDCVADNIDYRKLERLLRAFEPDLVVFNTATPSIDTDLITARVVRHVQPECKTGAIGIHVTVLADEVLRAVPELDFAVRGEPEETVLETARSLKTGMDKISGLSYRDGGRIVHNPDREFISNLDKLPFPDWSGINFKNYIMPLTNRPFLLLATSRGCQHHCLFCAAGAYYGKKIRKRSPTKVVEEMFQMKAEHGIADFLFWSDSFTGDREFSRAVADEIIARKGKFRWVCNSRVDEVDYELLRKFKKAGCWMIGYGIESGDQEILDRAAKGIKVEQIEEAVRAAKCAGLQVTGHVIFGLPGETRRTAASTLEFLDRLELDFCQFYCAVPFPGSRLYQLARKKKWIRARSFAEFEQNHSVLDTGGLSPQEVMKIRKLAFRHFYFQPRTIIRTVKKLRSIPATINFLKTIFKFYPWTV